MIRDIITLLQNLNGIDINSIPGSKNIPADALSRQTSADLPTESEPIIPPHLIVSPIIWNLDQDIHQATLQEPAPPECPEGKIYVPRSLRHNLLGTAYGSPGSGHPGSKRTLSLLQNHYWWPSMRRDTIRYVQSCSVCAMSNSPRMLPAGKLVPLPIPERPWSHLGVDFVSDLPSSEGEPSNVPAVDHWFQESERVWDSAHHHLQRAVCRSKHFADARRRTSPTFQPGDQVWLSTRDLRLRLPCRKLSPRYIGPFKILRQNNDVMFQLQLPPRYRIHPTFHVSLLKPFFPSATEPPGAELEHPPPEVLDQPSIYSVREILDSRRRGGHLEYLIDWEGYGPEERSWVPQDDVLDPMLLADFHRDHPDRPAPRGRGRPRQCVRASRAAPGGGGSVRHSPQPPSPATPPGAPPTRSSSLEF
ncbi:hypothetical protein M9458_052993 [Cirrhinus mrigala]|uniref:Gypsy retrotransposon integrase-like protein 1 n=1 Tax=Cirrhinus mrigala TaxID=683832 RepID=A0ABD0MNQ5_CIRMR